MRTRTPSLLVVLLHVATYGVAACTDIGTNCDNGYSALEGMAESEALKHLRE